MKAIFWGAIAVLMMVAVAAAPAHSREVYVAAAALNGDATYMAVNPDGTVSDQQTLMHPSDYQLSGYSFGNGIGDFNNDGQLDYIMALGRYGGEIYVFPKSGAGPQFDPPIWAGSWTEGIYPADIAVADFNGDGNLDFLMAYYYSTHCGLYLGDGDFGFSYSLLEDVKGMVAIGIDAADFNNDEIADFVVAPYMPGPFYVYLGKPDGTFTKVIADRTPSKRMAAGIAAGNFIEDGDGFFDLAVSAGGVLEIYRGNGDGTFALEYTWQLTVNTSPLDNGDFNGDGHQDLVVGGYGTDQGGVAVLLGDGQGQFEWDYTYLGEDTRLLKAVTALPYLPNKAPVALLTPEKIKVTVGETVEWDATGSYDKDGTIIKYEWDYGDGAAAPMGMESMDAVGTGEPQSSYVYYDSGTYYVTLKVTDDMGAITTIQAEVEVVPIAVNVRFSPRKLNLKSKGKWITATIWVPADHNAGMIDPDSLFLDLPGNKGAIQAHVSLRDRRDFKYFSKYHKHFKKKFHRKRKLKVKFDRQSLVELLDGANGPIALTVSGEISSMEFSGTDTITVLGNQKKSYLQKHLWKELMRWLSKGQSKHR